MPPLSHVIIALPKTSLSSASEIVVEKTVLLLPISATSELKLFAVTIPPLITILSALVPC